MAGSAPSSLVHDGLDQRFWKSRIGHGDDVVGAYVDGTAGVLNEDHDRVLADTSFRHPDDVIHPPPLGGQERQRRHEEKNSYHRTQSFHTFLLSTAQLLQRILMQPLC